MQLDGRQIDGRTPARDVLRPIIPPDVSSQRESASDVLGKRLMRKLNNLSEKVGSKIDLQRSGKDFSGHYRKRIRISDMRLLATGRRLIRYVVQEVELI